MSVGLSIMCPVTLFLRLVGKHTVFIFLCITRKIKTWIWLGKRFGSVHTTAWHIYIYINIYSLSTHCQTNNTDCFCHTHTHTAFFVSTDTFVLSFYDCVSFFCPQTKRH